MINRLKQWVRSRTSYIDPQYAQQARYKLSVIYALVCWNLLGVVVYSIWKEKVPKNRDSVDYAKILGINEAKVMKFSGFSKVAEYDLKVTNDEIVEYQEMIGTQEKLEEYNKKKEKQLKNRADVNIVT